MTQGRATYSMEFSHYAEVPRISAIELVDQVEGLTKVGSPRR